MAPSASPGPASTPPAAREPSTLASVGTSPPAQEPKTPADPDPLTSFAQHVLRGEPDSGESGFLSLENEIYTQQPAQGFEELLEGGTGGTEKRIHQAAEEVMNGLSGDLYDDQMREEGGDHGMGQAPPPPPERTRRGKRRREEDETPILMGHTSGRENHAETTDGEGMSLDPVRLKKDSHKEVERRRRENINDGILELAKYVPGGMDKGGKGVFLRRAAEYLGEMCEKVRVLETDYEGRETHDLQEEINRLRTQLAEEQARSIRYETSWREAEDRVAASQFELARVENDLKFYESRNEFQ